MRTDTLLVEIGTEELPPKSLNRMRLALAKSFAEGLGAAGLDFGEVSVFATPRRLAILATSLADQQPAQQIEKRGPALSAAYDDDGQPTKALTGFATSCGIDDPATLDTVKTDKGEWVVFRATQSGKQTEALLPDLLNEALAALPIDRRMRWGKRRDEFVRPVKWLCALHGKKVLALSLFGLTASNKSRGHRFMSGKDFTIRRADEYVEACRKQHVLVDFEERRAQIADGLQSKAAALGAKVVVDQALLDEVTALVEWPVVLDGAFDESFLAVPQEALISAMKAHQRYFHLVNADGGLLPRFIAVANIDSAKPEVVVAGNERVIRPRLADAAFFFQQDQKMRLADQAARLDEVVFQTELGSYGDKVRRIVHLAGFIASEMKALALSKPQQPNELTKAQDTSSANELIEAQRTSLPANEPTKVQQASREAKPLTEADKQTVRRAAELSKADLVTDMVGEFPELQG
ncbi:MAG: glycine--tRNA ligase subunit beta, partial [Pseudomonadales bacterium]